VAEDGFYDVGLGLLVINGRVLMVERDWDVSEFPGMAAFPGGDVDGDEHPMRGIVRIFQAETNVRADVRRKLGTVLQRLAFPDGSYEDYRLHVYEMQLIERRSLSENAFWVDAGRLDELDIVPSDLTIFERLYVDRDRYDTYEKPTFVSGIRKDRRGDYTHVEFERWDQGE